MELPVRLVEPLGRDTLLYFDAGTDRAFVAVREGLDMADVKVGAPMELSLDPRRLYLFDADGRRVEGTRDAPTSDGTTANLISRDP
jgi:hypothetical protein